MSHARAYVVGLAFVLLGCAKKDGASEAPTRGAASNPDCPAGGPSISVNILGREGGDEIPSAELGTLLEWIGGFAKPCMEATPEAKNFRLKLELGEAGEAPTLALVDRDALPGLAACLDAGFAQAPPPPPPGSMKVDVVIPWGCPTLGAGFEREDMQETEPPTKSEPEPQPQP